MKNTNGDRRAIENKTRRMLPFLLSIGLHFVMTLVLLFNPQFAPLTPNLAKQTEVELIDPEKLLEAMKARNDQSKGQIVEQSEERLNDEVPQDAKFLSRHKQKVVRETLAAEHGKFKNAQAAEGPSPQPQPAKAKTDPAKVRAETDREHSKAEPTKQAELFADESSSIEAKALKRRNMRDLMPSFKPVAPPIDAQATNESGGGGKSASDDHIKNVQTGMQTLLSTREFVYYSYYNRIKDKLRQYWEPKIKEKMERIVRQGRTIASTSDRITKIVIIDRKSVV